MLGYAEEGREIFSFFSPRKFSNSEKTLLLHESLRKHMLAFTLLLVADVRKRTACGWEFPDYDVGKERKEKKHFLYRYSYYNQWKTYLRKVGFYALAKNIN